MPILLFALYAACTGLLIFLYCFLIIRAIHHWHKLPVFQLPKGFQPQTFISVLIPVRNEAANIALCLQSILQQNYPLPLFEIIVLDDHSEDDTPLIVQKIRTVASNIHLLSLSDFEDEMPLNSYKKKAIEIGVAHAKGDLIVTTDGDCTVPKDWLLLLAACYETQEPQLIAAPVLFHQEKNWLEYFQSLDYAGMMLMTAAGIQSKTMRMSNGANLAYPKRVFLEVNGFQGIDHLASGDDMLLAQKIAARYPQGITFLKSAHAAVLTQAKPNWRGFLNQRIRWATKSATYREGRMIFVLGIVFLFCSNILLSLWMIPFVGWAMALVFVLQIASKVIADYQLLGAACRFFQRQDLMRTFFISEILHTLYIVIVGILSNLIKKYEWKGRKVR